MPPESPKSGGLATADRPTVASERKAAIARMREEIARYREEDSTDTFAVDASLIPDGMSYNWKRINIAFGKPDVQHQARLKRMGWTPVPARRHPELFGDVTNADAPAIHNDMMLMERPIEITRDAHLHDFRQARKNVADQTAKLKISSHDLMPRVLSKAKRSYQAVDIPDDE